jgi:hypothetical protein
MITLIPNTVEPRLTATSPALPRFAFEINLPPDCRRLPQPGEVPDFSQPTTFASLGTFVATYGTFVFSVTARPAYGEGSVRDWLFDLCQQRGLEIEHAAPAQLAGEPAATCLATQKTSSGLMKVRLTLLEDDGRLFVLTAAAPAALWRARVNTFDEMFASFKLLEKFGATVSLT